MKRVILLCVLFIVFCAAALYCVKMRPVVIRYESARSNVILQDNLLKKRKFLEQKNGLVKKALLGWKQKHPHFYEAMRLNETTDQLLQNLIHFVEQSGFLLIQVEPVANKKKSDRLFQLTLSGNYTNIFYLMRTVDNFVYPISLVKLTISKPGQMDCVFSVPV